MQLNTSKQRIIVYCIAIIFCLVAIILIYNNWKSSQQSISKFGQPDYKTISVDELKDGMIVKGDVDLVFAVYAEEYATNYGVKSSNKAKSLYCLIPVYTIDVEGYYDIQYILSLYVQTTDIEIIEKVIEQTYRNSETEVLEPIKLVMDNAYIYSIGAEPKKLLEEFLETLYYENGTFLDWCIENNIFPGSDALEIRSKIVPYVIKKTEVAGTNINIVWLFSGLGALFIVLLIIVLK